MNRDNLFDIALAYTTKISKAENIEDFLEEFEKNQEKLIEIYKSKPTPKVNVVDRSKFGF